MKSRTNLAKSLSACAALLCLASISPALAGDVVPSPMLDYGPYMRNITNFNDTSDSTCIGHPITPLCTMETFLAAQLRDDEELWDIAHGKKAGPPKVFKDASAYNSGIFGYRVIAVRQFPPHILPSPESNRFNIQAWDVAMDIETNVCTYAPCTQGALNSNENHILRKGEYGWYVVSSGARGHDLTNPSDVGLSACSD